MAEETIVEKDGVEYVVDEVKSAKNIVGLAPTRHAVDLDELLEIVDAEKIFKLAYAQLRTNHQNIVRAKFNGKGKSAVAVINALGDPENSLTVEKINEEMKKSHTTFTDAATNLLTTAPDPNAIHWDVL